MILDFEGLRTIASDESHVDSNRCQSSVSVVVSKSESIFRATGEHAVRFVDAAGHQVVDQYTDVGLFATEDQGLLALDARAPRWHRRSALGAGFFVTGRAVDLPGEE